MIVLGIETSCDETAVAILDVRASRRLAPTAKILSNLIASQHEIHAPYGGIFPELASRRHIEVIRPLVEDALKEAGVSQDKIEGIAVTNAPGLVGSLLVGVSFAKAYAFGLDVPFVGVSHLEGHLNAPLLEYPQEIRYPHIGLIVSGGHTALYRVKKFGHYEFLGGTRDDAAGEAFDKVAKILGLGYPGGPVIDAKAREGNASAVRFPKPKMKGYDFSFSGLKTAAKMIAERNPPQSPFCKGGSTTSPPFEKGGQGGFSLPDLCASFQETVVDILVDKAMSAAKNRRCKTILVTGGVACNSRLRVKMAEAAVSSGRRAFFASPVLSTDNAAMIAYVGGRKLLAGQTSPLSLNAVSNLALGAA